MDHNNTSQVVSLVERVHLAATEIGVDVSPRDTAFIISLFLEGLGGDDLPGLRPIIEAVNSVKDEI